MTAKQYLQQLRALDTKINQRIKQAEELRELAFTSGSVLSDTDRVQTSPSGTSRQQAAMEKYIDMEREINKLIDDFVKAKNRIISQIQKLDDPRHMEILYKRYVEFKDFYTIADEMSYARETVCRIHGVALQEFERTCMI